MLKQQVLQVRTNYRVILCTHGTKVGSTVLAHTISPFLWPPRLSAHVGLRSFLLTPGLSLSLPILLSSSLGAAILVCKDRGGK